MLEGNIEIGKHLLVFCNERDQLSWERIGMDVQQADGKITFQATKASSSCMNLLIFSGPSVHRLQNPGRSG
jgi:hypothetical protein